MLQWPRGRRLGACVGKRDPKVLSALGSRHYSAVRTAHPVGVAALAVGGIRFQSCCPHRPQAGSAKGTGGVRCREKDGWFVFIFIEIF